ncbi:MAG: DUF1573 domain-containing protein [Isosphaeraceae bacterium]
MMKSPSRLIAAGLGLALLAAVLWAVGGFSAIRSIGRETISVDSRARSFGVVARGDRIAVSFKLTNHGRDPVRIVGCRAGCGCMLPEDLPFSIRPNGSRDFRVSIKFPPAPAGGPVVETRTYPLTLFTSNPDQFEIPLTVSGEVRGVPGASNAGL